MTFSSSTLGKEKGLKKKNCQPVLLFLNLLLSFEV